jgi:hypothetical protein
MPILWKILLAVILLIFGIGALGGGLLGWSVGASLFVATLCVSGVARKNQ